MLLPLPMRAAARAPAPSSPSFDPTTVSGNIGWWDGQDAGTLTVAADEVTGWTDKSGAGNDLAPAGGAFQPGYTASSVLANDYPALTWPATASNGIGLGTASAQTVDFFMVVLAYGDGTQTTYNAHRYIWNGSDFNNRTHGTISNNFVTSLFGTDMLLNGVSIASNANSLPMGLSIIEVASNDPGNRTLQWLGVTHTGINGWYGVMCESLWYSSIPSAGDRTFLREGLAEKWGITL